MVFLKAHLSHRMDDPEYLIKCLIDYIDSEIILKKDDDTPDGFSAENFDSNKDSKEEKVGTGLVKLGATVMEEASYYEGVYASMVKTIKRIEESWKKGFKGKDKFELVYKERDNPIGEQQVLLLNTLSYVKTLKTKEAKRFIELYRMTASQLATLANKTKESSVKELKDELNALKITFTKEANAKNIEYKGKMPLKLKFPSIEPKDKKELEEVSHKDILSQSDSEGSDKIIDILNKLVKTPAYKEFLKLGSQKNTRESSAGKKESILSILENTEKISGNIENYITTYGANVQEQIFQSIISELTRVKSIARKVQGIEFSKDKKDGPTSKKDNPKLTNILLAVKKIDEVIKELNARLTRARKARKTEDVWAKKTEKEPKNKINEKTLSFLRGLSEDLIIFQKDINKKDLSNEEALVKFFDGKNKKLVYELLLRLDSTVEATKQTYPEFGERTPGIQLDAPKKIKGVSAEELENMPSRPPRTADEKEKAEYEKWYQRAKRKYNSTILSLIIDRKDKMNPDRLNTGTSKYKSIKKADENQYYTMFDIIGSGETARLEERGVNSSPYTANTVTDFSKLKGLYNKIQEVLNSKKDKVSLKSIIKNEGGRLLNIVTTPSDKRKRGQSALDRLKEKKRNEPSQKEWGSKIKSPNSLLSSIEDIVGEQISDLLTFRTYFTNENVGKKFPEKDGKRIKVESAGWTGLNDLYSLISELVTTDKKTGKVTTIDDEDAIPNIKYYYNSMKDLAIDEKQTKGLKQKIETYQTRKDLIEKQMVKISGALEAKTIDREMKAIEEVSKKLKGIKTKHDKLSEQYIKISNDIIKLPEDKESGTKDELELKNAKAITNRVFSEILPKTPNRAKKSMAVSEIIKNPESGEASNIELKNYMEAYSKAYSQEKYIQQLKSPKYFGEEFSKIEIAKKVYAALSSIPEEKEITEKETDKILDSIVQEFFSVRGNNREFLKNAIKNALDASKTKINSGGGKEVFMYRLIEIFRTRKAKSPKFSTPIYEVVEDTDGLLSSQKVSRNKLLARLEKKKDGIEDKLEELEQEIIVILDDDLGKIETNSPNPNLQIKFISAEYYLPEQKSEGFDGKTEISPSRTYTVSEFKKVKGKPKQLSEYRPEKGPSFTYYEYKVGDLLEQQTIFEILNNNFDITIDAYTDYKKLQIEFKRLNGKIKRMHKSLNSIVEKLKKEALEEEE